MYSTNAKCHKFGACISMSHSLDVEVWYTINTYTFCVLLICKELKDIL